MVETKKSSKKGLLIGVIAIVGVAATLAISAATDGTFGFNTNGDKQDNDAFSGDFIEFNENNSDSYSDSTELEAVNGYSGTATATREFDGTEFSHTVTATTDPPAEGKFYEGWIVGGPDGFISTGKLEQDEQQDWTLVFLSQENKQEYERIVITEETEADGLDNKPETHVFEGSF